MSYNSKAWEYKHLTHIIFLGAGTMLTVGIGSMVIAGLPTTYNPGKKETKFGNGSFFFIGGVLAHDYEKIRLSSE